MNINSLIGTTILYDIKSYFPNEDRVKNATISVDNIKKYVLPSQEQTLSKLGLIRKIKGSYYLEILDNFNKHLDILQGYSHIKIIWWFHRFEKEKYKRTLECDPPYKNAPKTGIFALRSPVRPNPFAITTAKILNIDYDLKRIKVSMLDCFDKTPFVGISPYIPEIDFISEYRLPAWVEHWSAYLDDSDFNTSKLPVLVQYPVILSASLGDCVAMDMVLKHYARYINSLCMRTFYDEAGNPHICIDEDMKNCLESKLIANYSLSEASYILYGWK